MIYFFILAAGLLFFMTLPLAAKTRFDWRGPFDAILYEAAHTRHDAAALKALADRETSFNQSAVNPETQEITAAELRSAILSAADGGLRLMVRYNPSLGLLQLRWSTAKNLGAPNPAALLGATANVHFAALLYRQMQSQGIIFPRDADAWNVGAGGNWRRGVRNRPYQQYVEKKWREYLSDFPE